MTGPCRADDVASIVAMCSALRQVDVLPPDPSPNISKDHSLKGKGKALLPISACVANFPQTPFRPRPESWSIDPGPIRIQSQEFSRPRRFPPYPRSRFQHRDWYSQCLRVPPTALRGILGRSCCAPSSSAGGGRVPTCFRKDPFCGSSRGRGMFCTFSIAEALDLQAHHTRSRFSACSVRRASWQTIFQPPAWKTRGVRRSAE